MKKYLTILLVTCLLTNIKANSDSLEMKKKSWGNKFAIRADVNAMKVTGSSGFRTAGINGALQLDYVLNKTLFLSTYIGYMADLSPKERYYQIENKVYDLTTSRMLFYGIGLGYKVWNEGRFLFYPDLRVGLGHFGVKEIFQPLNNEFNLKRNIAMVMPRANFCYRLSKNIEPGITFSYLFPIPLNGDIKQYDLNNINSGLFCKILF
jgi:hypothetical protein